MRVEISPRQFSVRIYKEGEDEKYDIASCQIFAYGDRGFMYSIHGPGFYKAILQIWEQVEKEGLKTLEGYVSKGHARLLRMANPKFNQLGWNAEMGEEGMFGSHKLVWVVLRKICGN